MPKEEVDRINAAGGTIKDSMGVDPNEYLPAAKLGVTKVNIDTDGRLVWTRVHREFFRDKPADFDFRPPGKIFIEEYAKFIASRNELLGSRRPARRRPRPGDEEVASRKLLRILGAAFVAAPFFVMRWNHRWLDVSYICRKHIDYTCRNNDAEISSAEWEVMNVVWAKHPITAGEVLQGLPEEKGWAQKTVNTFLTRLVEKGVLAAQPAPAEEHMSTMSTSECVSSQSTYRRATAISAWGDRADNGSTETDSGDESATATSAVAGASSMSTCAFVPENPKELIPARLAFRWPATGSARSRPGPPGDPTECVATGVRNASSSAAFRVPATARP